MNLLATYFHNWNPVIIELGPLALRWYGFAYLMGFVAAILLLRFLHQKQRYVIGGEQVSDFIVMGAVFGVLLGGRLGYFFFYWLPTYGFEAWMQDFFYFIRFWDGGMASHGGILGLMFYSLWYAKKHQLSWTALGDGLCVVAPLGIGFGRLANFINGELYGRIVHGFDGAMLFPGELLVSKDSGTRGLDAARAGWHLLPETLQHAPYQTQLHWMIEEALSNEAIAKHLASFCEPRYPSQLYQAGMEGFGLCAILFAIRWFWKSAPAGLLTGIFFIGYAFCRILGEQFREPDSALIGIFTKGQFYSFFMIFIGLGFILWSMRTKLKQSKILAAMFHEK